MKSFEKGNEVRGDKIEEMIEDIGLMNAIKKGEKTKNVDRQEIFRILEGK